MKRSNQRTSELTKKWKQLENCPPYWTRASGHPLCSSPNLSVSKPNNLAARPLVLTDNRLLVGEETTGSQPYTKTTWWARACRTFRGNHVLTAIYKDDMMSASLPQISRKKPRAHSHIQRRHDERELAANNYVVTGQRRQQLLSRRWTKSCKVELNLLLSCGSWVLLHPWNCFMT